MLYVLLCLVSGILCGYLIRNRKSTAVLERITGGIILLLLFILGMTVVSNKTILQNLSRIGLKAFTLTFGGILGSSTLSLAVYRIFFRDDKRTDASYGEDTL